MRNPAHTELTIQTSLKQMGAQAGSVQGPVLNKAICCSWKDQLQHKYLDKIVHSISREPNPLSGRTRVV